MAILDATVFLIMLGLACFFLFYSFRLNYIFDALMKLFAMILFMSVALFLSAEFDIVWQGTATDGVKTWEFTDPLIISDHQYIALIFYILGIASAILFFKSMSDYKSFKDSEMEQLKW